MPQLHGIFASLPAVRLTSPASLLWTWLRHFQPRQPRPRPMLRCPTRAHSDSARPASFHPTRPSSWDRHRDRGRPGRSARPQSPASDTNIIELFDVLSLNRGYMDGRIKSNFPTLPPMVGFASTASFRSDAPPRGSDAYGSMDQQVAGFAELPGPAVVVFQDLDEPAVAATFGEVMCSVYKGFGSVGLITSGAGGLGNRPRYFRTKSV